MPLSTMNWKRGLLRLWAVAAVLWVGVAFYSNDTVQHVVPDLYALFTSPGPKHDCSSGVGTAEIYCIVDGPIQTPFDLANLAFIPPLFLLALGYVGLWVWRGFRR